MKFSSFFLRAICVCLLGLFDKGLFAQPINDVCSFATDIQSFINQSGQPLLAGPYSNVGATGSDMDIATVTGCWLDDLTGNADGSSPQVDATVWFRFEGYDGELMLYVQPCDTNLTFLSQDTQMALYSGECDTLELVACNEDINASINNYWSGLTTTISAGTTYYLAVDGFNYSGFGSPELPLTTGEFCLSFTQPVVAVETNSMNKIEVFPNPSQGLVHVQADSFIHELKVYNSIGQSCGEYALSHQRSFELNLPEVQGVYTLLLRTERGTTLHRVIKN